MLSVTAASWPDPVTGRDIAYWYPLHTNTQSISLQPGDVVYITNELFASSQRPSVPGTGVCGIVVPESQPWAAIGASSKQSHPDREHVLVCIKGQIPVNIAPSSALPQQGSMLTPCSSDSTACEVVPEYCGCDCVIGCVVSTLPIDNLASKQRVLAHVYMPAVQVGPRYCM